VPDVVRFEDLDQALVLVAALLDTLELVAGAAERAAGSPGKGMDRRRRLLARVDEVLVERAEDAVAARVDLADVLAMLARGLDHARGARVDDGGHAARLCIEGVPGHGLLSVLSVVPASVPERGENPVADFFHRSHAVDAMVVRRARVARGGPRAVVLDERLGLAMIDREAIAHRRFLVVLALAER